MFRQNSNSVLGAFAADVLALNAAAALAWWARVNGGLGKPLGSPDVGLPWLLAEAVPLYSVVFFSTGVYDAERPRTWSEDLVLLAGSSTLAALALAGATYFTARDTSRMFLLLVCVLQLAAACSWRLAAQSLRRERRLRGRADRRVLLIGAGEPLLRAAAKMRDIAWTGTALVGYVGDALPERPPELERLGGAGDADTVIRERAVDDVLLAFPAERFAELTPLMARLVESPCMLWMVPDYFSLLLYGAEVADLGGLPMVSLKVPTLTRQQRLVKRAFDLVLGATSLLLLGPLMLLIAALVKLTSPGPVLFRQKRAGENGRRFTMVKFRSMVADAERRVPEVVRYDEQGRRLHKSESDPRVTWIGRLLRRASLDELPQLLNVLRGDMSLVGPRPELPDLVDSYEPWQRQRFAVPQGITGWWQIQGRSTRPMHLHTEDDVYYVRNYSLLLDVQILLRTAMVVVRGRGAY